MECQEVEEISDASLKSVYILRSILKSKTGITIKNISAETGLSPSTIHRITMELLGAGFIRRIEDNKYKLSYNSINMFGQVNMNDYMFEISKQEMINLNNLTGETIHLISKVGDNGVYLGKINTKNAVGIQSYVGKTTPLYCTSGGKIILAYEDPLWVEDYLHKTELKKYSDYTITDKDQLLLELEAIRQNAFSYDKREYNQDVFCVAVPVFNEENAVVSTLSIAAPKYRFSMELATTYIEDLKKSATIISKNLKSKEDI